MNALVSLILAGALILGGGATAVAAQDDLPNQPLYPVKLMTENATLALTGDPQLQANLLMNMAQTRVEEMVALAGDGIPVPAQVGERLQQQIQQTLMLAADMDDAALTQTLLQLREQLQTQEQLMAQLHAETDPLLTQTRQMLQTRLQQVDDGLADPQGFRYTMTNQKQYGQDETLLLNPTSRVNLASIRTIRVGNSQSSLAAEIACKIPTTRRTGMAVTAQTMNHRVAKTRTVEAALGPAVIAETTVEATALGPAAVVGTAVEETNSTAGYSTNRYKKSPQLRGFLSPLQQKNRVISRQPCPFAKLTAKGLESYESSTTSAACKPFGPSSTANSTCCSASSFL